MIVKINNKATETLAQTLADIAQQLELPERGVAMALNAQMIQRDKWCDTSIKEQDEIIIIKAVCGG